MASLCQLSPNRKAIIIGLYGVPGSGKTYLLRQLPKILGEDCFAFYEGSTQIAALVPGGLSEFERLCEPEKQLWRQSAIDTIVKQCANNNKIGVVTGHLMLWAKGSHIGLPIFTENDLLAFTNIIYLDISPKEISEQSRVDQERSRDDLSVEHLRRWQLAEKSMLPGLCRQHGILLSFVSGSPRMALLHKIRNLVQDLSTQNESYNLCHAKALLDEALATRNAKIEKILVLDADRTLAGEDTGELFWERIQKSRCVEEKGSPMKALFSSALSYSYTAFRQATLLYEDAVDDQEFEDICTDVASDVMIFPEFLTLLQHLREQEHTGAVVVTCGLRRVWEKIIEREGLSRIVAVIGGGRISDGIVITPQVKSALVSYLRNVHRLRVWAFGDSPLDLDMLCEAQEAIVVVGEEATRSHTMDEKLMSAIETKALCARQVLLPSTAALRLDTTRLPVIRLTDPDFVRPILSKPGSAELHFIHLTRKPAAKLLATSMRDSGIAGPRLREAHQRAGIYIATEELTDLIGLELCPITHVLGHPTSGYRLFHESQTLIVALMRGGEPMASGVNDAFPDASFLHAKEAEDIRVDNLYGMVTVILVDSVINTGKTVVRFVRQIRKLNATIRVIIVAGVIQDQTVSEGGTLRDDLREFLGVSLVALRLSETKFTGTRGTDTGNRLFNTTHLD